jgi:PAS domain S-box-containing protein
VTLPEHSENNEQSLDWFASLYALSESSPDAIIIKDAQGKILGWNQAAEMLYGFSAEEVVGKPISIIAPAGGWGEVLSLIGAARNGSVIRDWETTRRRKDGVEMHVALTVTPLRDARGNLLGICTVARDVTGRKTRFNEMSWIASIVESSEDAIIGKTLDGEIVSWNQAAENIYGWKSWEALGRHISILASPEQSDEIPELMRKVALGESVDHFETWRRTRTGEMIHVELKLSPIRDGTGGVIGISTIARPVPA